MFNEPQVIRRPTTTKDTYWTPERDRKLIELVKFYGGRLSWNQLSMAFPGVNGKCIKQRYRRHLDTKSNNNEWTEQQIKTIKNQYIRYGRLWEQIARLLPGRSVNEIKSKLTKISIKHQIADDDENQQVRSNMRSQKVKIPRKSMQKKEKKQKPKKEKGRKKSQREIKRKAKNMTSGQKAVINHMNKMVNLIEEDIKKNNLEYFPTTFLNFEGCPFGKKQILSRLLTLHWVLTNLWGQLAQEPIQATRDEQIFVFLLSLYQQRNEESKKLLEGLANCHKEEYLIDHLGELIEKIQAFNKNNPEIYEQIYRNGKEDEDLLQLMQDFSENEQYLQSALDTMVKEEDEDLNVSEFNLSTVSQLNIDNLSEIMQNNVSEFNLSNNSNNQCKRQQEENCINFIYEEPESENKGKRDSQCPSLSLF